MGDARLGLMIGATFGLVYVLVNAGVQPAPLGLLLRLLGVGAYVAVLLSLRRRPASSAASAEGRPAFTRSYWLVVAGEVAAFVAGNLILNVVLDLPLAVLPWVTFVVGVHFLVLARLWSASSLSWLGAALAVCGVAGLGLALAGAGEAAIAAVAGVAPGFLLLAGSLFAALHPER